MLVGRNLRQAVSGQAQEEWPRDVIEHVTIRFAICRFLLVFHWKPLSRAVPRILFQPRQKPSLPFPSPPFISFPLFLPLFSIPLPILLPFLPRGPTPLIQLEGLGERYKLSQWVRAEPGRQMVSDAF